MKRLIAGLFVMALIFTGCATARLPADATADQRAAAQAQDCASAQQAYIIADQALNSPNMDLEAQRYWNTYKTGAQLGITIACGAAAVPVVQPAISGK